MIPPVVPRSIIRARSVGASFEGHTARDWVIATNIAFVPASIALVWNGWTFVGIHTMLVTVASFLYHLDLESARYAMLDQTLATLLFAHIVAFACETGCWPVGVCVTTGLVAWKLGHKCHCSDKAVCGHAYDSLPALMHGSMHLISAIGAASLAMMATTQSVVPFGRVLFAS
jgi:hypothetical protein